VTLLLHLRQPTILLHFWSRFGQLFCIEDIVCCTISEEHKSSSARHCLDDATDDFLNLR